MTKFVKEYVSAESGVCVRGWVDEYIKIMESVVYAKFTIILI